MSVYLLFLETFIFIIGTIIIITSYSFVEISRHWDPFKSSGQVSWNEHYSSWLIVGGWGAVVTASIVSIKFSVKLFERATCCYLLPWLSCHALMLAFFNHILILPGLNQINIEISSPDYRWWPQPQIPWDNCSYIDSIIFQFYQMTQVVWVNQ